MRLPRDISGKELIHLVKRFRYIVSRQTGSHLRLTTLLKGEHHITIPKHLTLKIGTLNSIITDIAVHFEVSKEEVMEKLFN